MANRYAPYKAKYLTREPKKLVGKFTVVNAANGALTMSNAPFNKGIYAINHTGTGVYKISLGGSSTMVDPYAYLGGVQVTFSEAERIAYVTNDQAGNTTTPFVEITVANGSGTAINVANTKTVSFELTFLDSID